tara:strand:- start:4168 stop:5013 length:846 start_codon:yes stop_codon:yes gene_type:complete
MVNRTRLRWWRGEYRGTICRFKDGEIVCDDALNFLNALEEECADVIFVDPPFNLGKKYGKRSKKKDCVEESIYSEYMTNVLKRGVQVLKTGGTLYLYHLPIWALRFGNILEEEGLSFRHWIAISMKNGFVRGNHLHPAHYALLYFTKGKPNYFSRPKIDIAKCRHCGKDIKDYGGYKKYVKDGINLSDYWEDISPVRHKKYKYREENELPISIVSRVINISGVKGGLVVDPFIGTGSVLDAAKSKKMNFVGADIEKKFLNIAKTRLSKRDSIDKKKRNKNE